MTSIAPARPNQSVPDPGMRRPSAAPRSWADRFVGSAAALVGLGLAITVGLAVHSESLGSLSAPGGLATAAGRLTGLVGTYLMLVALLLVARIPWVEQAAGQERLVRWHRWLGPWPIVLLLAHAVLITVGYAAASAGGVVPMAWQLVTQYPNVLAATVALALLLAAGVTSWRVARRRLRHETWWTIHLYIYLAAALALAHQVTAGAAFVASPLAKAWWLALWACTAGVVVVFRFGLPVWRTARHMLRVVEVQPEGPGIYSVIMRGRALDRLPIRGGQYMQWRFFRRGHLWQAHPYSLSAMPRGRYLRITVKALGDHSADLARLKRGTWVAVEGSYGRLTREVMVSDRALLLAGGVGVTPLRALLEDLPRGVHPVVVVRASQHDELMFRDELAQLVSAMGGRVEFVVGSRREVQFAAREIFNLVPDVRERDVFMCGPDGLVEGWRQSLNRLGVPKAQVHSESFGV
ncbi:MAG TPA: ferredoxin reductase family protein [Actinomycetes bacterium]|nr:ferredoxin reductase family protein [Actinomycetes bacterium]